MSVLELVDNVFQLVVFGAIVVFANVFAVKNPKFILLQYFAGGMACAFTGTLFWTVYFVIYGEFPYYFSAADLCYLCLYMFLIGLCRKYFKDNIFIPPTVSNKLTALIFPVIVIGINTACYLLVGGLFYNVFYAVPLTILAYFASINVIMLRGKPESKHAFNFYIVLIIYILINNFMFLFSSLYLNTVYIAFDFMLTLTFLIMLIMLKKEGENDLR